MERKTIGTFIAALRRANGMTQRELAERLNISDKTVSRWERDDGVPDLSLIPVIAEIFGITCDELLRGERRPAPQREEAGEREPSAKGERQRRYLLRKAMSAYQVHTYVAMGIAGLGFLAALICNFAFLRAVLGFFIGAGFYAAGAVCQAAFVNRALLSVDEEELGPGEAVSFKNRVVLLAARSGSIIAGLLGFTLPLLLAGDAYLGLTFGGFLGWGTIGAALVLAVYGVLWEVLKAALVRWGTLALGEGQEAAYRHNLRLKRICAAVTGPILVLTLIAHAVLYENRDLLVRSQVFNDNGSFTEFMGQETEPPYGYNEIQVFPETDEPPEDALIIEDDNGQVVCVVLPNMPLIHAGFFALYALELGLTLAIYLKKRQKSDRSFSENFL